MSVEALKAFFDVGTVILLFLAFAFGAGVLITGNIINERQAEQIKQFDKGLTDAKTELAKSQATTAILQSVVMPLDLSDKQQSDIGAASKQYAGRSILVSSNPTDIEGRILARLIIEALRRGGVKAVPAPQVGVTWGGQGSGVMIVGPDRQFAVSLKDILDTFGELNATVPEPDKNAPEPAMTIIVGVYPFKKRDMAAPAPASAP
jgi:hypothetical protein